MEKFLNFSVAFVLGFFILAASGQALGISLTVDSSYTLGENVTISGMLLEDNGTGIPNKTVSYTIKYGSTTVSDIANTSEEAGNGSFYINFEPPEVNEYTVTATASHAGSSTIAQTKFSVLEEYNYKVTTKHVYSVGEQIAVKTEITNSTGDPVSGEGVVASLLDENGTVLSQDSDTTNANGEATSTFSSQGVGKYFIDINGVVSRIIKVKSYDMMVDTTDAQGLSKKVFSPDENIPLVVKLVDSDKNPINETVAVVAYRIVYRNGTVIQNYTIMNESGPDTGVYETSDILMPAGKYTIEMKADAMGVTQKEKIKFRVQGYFIHTVAVSVKDDKYPERPHDVFGPGKNVTIGVVIYDVANDEFETAYDVDIVLRKFGDWVSRPVTPTTHGPFEIENMNVTVLEFPSPENGEYIAELKFNISDVVIHEGVYFRIESLFAYMMTADDSGKFVFTFSPEGNVFLNVKLINASSGNETSVTGVTLEEMRDDSWNDITSTAYFNATNSPSVWWLQAPNETGHYYVRVLVNGEAHADSWFEVRAYEIFADSSRWFYSPSESVMLTVTVKDFMGNPVSGTSVDVNRIRNEVTNKEYGVGTDVTVKSGFTDSNGEVEIEISPPSGGWSVGHYSVELVSRGEYGWTGFEIKQFVTHVDLFSGPSLDDHQDIFGSDSNLSLRVFAHDLNKKPISVNSTVMGVMYQGTDKNPLWPPRKVNVTLPAKFETTSTPYGDGISELIDIEPPAGGWKQGNYFIMVQSEYSGQQDFARRHFGIKAYYLKLKPELNDIVHDPVFQSTETFNTTVGLVNASGGTYGLPVNITLVGIHDIMLGRRLYREDELTSFNWTGINDGDNISIDLSTLSDLHAGECWFDFRAESVDGEIYSGMWLVVTPFIPFGWDDFENRPTDYFGDFLPSENVTGEVYVMYPNGSAVSGVNVTVVKLMHFTKKEVNITDAEGMVIGGYNSTAADGKTTITLTSPGGWKGGFYKAILRVWLGDDEVVPPEWASPGFSIRSFMIDWSLRDNEHHMPYLPNKTITVDFEVRYPDGSDATNDIYIYLPFIIDEKGWIPQNATGFGQVKYLPDPEHERYSIEFVAPPDPGFYIAQFFINGEEEYHVWFEVMKTPEGDDILESWMWPRAVSMKGLHYGLGIGNKVGNDYPISNANVSLKYPDILNVPNEWEIFPSPDYFNNTEKMIVWTGVSIGNESQDFHYYAEPGGEPQGIYKFEWNVSYEYDNYSIIHQKAKSVPTDVLASEVLPGLVGESVTQEFNLTLTNLGQKGNATNARIRLWLNREFAEVNCSTCIEVEQHPWGDWELMWLAGKIENGTSKAKTYSFTAKTPSKHDTWIGWSVEYEYSNFEVEHVNWKDISVGDAIEVRVWPGAATPGKSEWFSLELRNKLRDRSMKYPRIEVFGLDKIKIEDLEGVSVNANTNGSLIPNTTAYERIDSSASVIREGYITLRNGKEKLLIVIWNTTGDDNFVKLGIDWNKDGKIDDIMTNGTERHPFSHYPYKVVVAPDGSSAGFESVLAKVDAAPLAGAERNISVVDTDSDGWFDSVYVEDDGTSDYNFTGDGPYEWGKLATVNTTEFWVKELCKWEGDCVRFIQKSKFDAVNVNATLTLPQGIQVSELEGGVYNETSNEIEWTDSIVPSDDEQRFEFGAVLPLTGLDYYNFTYNVTYYTNETGTLQPATPVSRTIKVWRDVFESKVTPEFCALDGVLVKNCTFTINITNKYNGNITVKFLDVRMDSVFNVSKADIVPPSGFNMSEPYFRVETNGDIAFRWELYGMGGMGDKFVNFTANESKTMNITVHTNPAPGAAALLDQIYEDGRKHYWMNWYIDYQNPQGFDVGHFKREDLYLGDVLDDEERVSSMQPGKPHNMFFFDMRNSAWTREGERAEMSAEDRQTACSGFTAAGVVVNEKMGEMMGDADPSQWIHPHMYHPMYGSRLENISCNMGGFYCEESPQTVGYSPKLANFSIWGHTLYVYIFDSNNNGQAEHDAVFFGKKNETSGEYLILEDMADLENLGGIFHAPDTELNITTLSDTAFGLTSPYCPNGSETIEEGEYNFVIADSDSDGSYDTAYIDLDGDGFYNTTDFERNLTAGDKTYFGGNPYYITDVTSWGDRVFLGKETLADVTNMNVSLFVPDDLRIIYATGGTVMSDTQADWENLVITSDGWKEFPVVLELVNITVFPSVREINWTVNYTFKNMTVTHEGSKEVVIDKDRISVELVPLYLAAADQQEQFELKFKADQGLDVDISRIEIYIGACQEMPQQGCDKVDNGYTINFVSTSGCDAVDDSKRIK
ncbi:MAG: hypothetical protein JSV63_00175, partial [Candidatus Aenigmatarchaeota archaeon]